MPTDQGERELMLDRQSPFPASGSSRQLEQAQSPLMTLVDGEPSLQAGHCPHLVQAVKSERRLSRYFH